MFTVYNSTRKAESASQVKQMPVTDSLIRGEK